MTQQEVEDLYAAYKAAKDVYDIEVVDNYKAHNGLNNIPISATDASLATKKKIMDAAYAAYNDAVNKLTSQQQAEFAIKNPSVVADIAKKTLEANYAAKNTKYIIIAVVVIVVVLGVVYFIRKRKKAVVA